MNWTKTKHIVLVTLGLLSAFAGVVYQSQLADNQVGAGMTFGVLAGLVPMLWMRLQAILGKPDADDYSAIERAIHVSAAVAGAVMPVLVLVHSKFDAGSQAFIVTGYVGTFLGDLVKAAARLPLPGDTKLGTRGSVLAAVLVAGALLASPRAMADEPTPSDVAPPISFCLGGTFHCVMPDFNISTVNYDLDAKKWKAGVTSVAVGYMLVFYSDQPWGSGFALHGAGQWSQGQPSYFAIVPTIVLAKYFEVGMSFIFLDGAVEKNLTLGLSANAELFMQLFTGKSVSTRLGEARLAYREALDRAVAEADERRREGEEDPISPVTQRRKDSYHGEVASVPREIRSPGTRFRLQARPEGSPVQHVFPSPGVRD